MKSIKMRVIVNQNYPVQHVERVLTDDQYQGLNSGDFVVSVDMADKIKEFLTKKATNGLSLSERRKYG